MSTRPLGARPRASREVRLARRLAAKQHHPDVSLRWFSPIWLGRPRPRKAIMHMQPSHLYRMKKRERIGRRIMRTLAKLKAR